MKPGDHPDFFRFPAPPGRSRESTIVLDRLGRFFHDDERVEHQGLHDGFARWIDTHPDDGRFILQNGYDWCYFTVESTPYFVTALRDEGGTLVIDLFDGTSEPLATQTLRIDEDDVLRVLVKDGKYDARFSQAAQLMVAPFLEETEDGSMALVSAGTRFTIASS